MIHFRFHVVSILAVFLAIAIGTVMGASFVGRGLVENLQSRIDEVEKNADEVRADKEALEREVGELNQYAQESAQFAVNRTLTAVPVTVVAPRGVDGAAIDAMVALLTQAGATVPDVIWLEPRWQLPDAEAATALRQATGLSTRARGALRSAAAGALGARLGPAVPPDPADDVLAQLVESEFVSLAPIAGGADPEISAFGGPGTRVLVVGGPAAQVSGSVLLEVTSGIIGAGGGATVGQIYAGDNGVPARSQWIEPFEADDVLRNRVSTVDNLERVEGRVAAVLALAGIPAGAVGRYGLDADRALPEQVPVVAVVAAA